MRVSLAVLAAFLASNQRDNLLVSAFQPSRDINRQNTITEQQQQQQLDPNHPRQSTRLNDASAMPYLSNWKLLPEGNIQGIIFGHPFLQNGDVVTTSQIKSSASENQIIETESGSQYLLRDRDADEEITSETPQNFNNKVAGPLLGGAVFAAGAVGLTAMDGEGARFDTAAPAQVFKEMSAVSLNQLQNSAKSLQESIDMPYLASKVSEAEKQFQAARENMLKQKGPESNIASSPVIAKQEDAQTIQQALSLAAEKVAIEKAALNEKVAWENFVNKEIVKEKAETEAMKMASSAAAKALSENNLDEAKAAMERAQMAKAAVVELQAERQSATLAEESAEAEELFAEQDVMKVIKEIRKMATMYSAKAAGFKPADALYYLEELRINPNINPQLAEYMNTPERQVALASIAAAAATGTVLAGVSGPAKKDEQKKGASAAPMASTSTKKVEKQMSSSVASPIASNTSEKVVQEPAPAQPAPAQPTPVVAKSTGNATPAASTTSATAGAATKSKWGSYLDVLGSYSSGSSVVPSSYSPFGKKATGMTSHASLYAPPSAKYVPPVAAAASSTTVTAPVSAVKTTAATPTTPAQEQEQPRNISGSSSGYLDALSGPPGAAVMSSYSPFAPKKQSHVSPKNKPQIPSHIRLAYNEWCEYYGKKNDESRMEIFAKNFADAKEFYKESGRALLLNEYADLTASEYKLLPNTA